MKLQNYAVVYFSKPYDSCVHRANFTFVANQQNICDIISKTIESICVNRTWARNYISDYSVRYKISKLVDILIMQITEGY